MMWNRAALAAAGAAAVLAVVAACGGGDSGAGQSTAQTTSASSSSAAASGAPATQDHNEADVMFAQHMIPHHRQAVEMSDIVLAKQGVDPRITDLATRIKAAQGPEIDQMQAWLDQWGNPAMPPMAADEGHGAGHPMNGMSGDAMGMMSDQQMTALKNADGAQAGRLFLNGMITHHEGAIAMAQNQIKDGSFAPAVDLARSIVTTQQHEIDEMKGILATL